VSLRRFSGRTSLINKQEKAFFCDMTKPDQKNLVWGGGLGVGAVAILQPRQDLIAHEVGDELGELLGVRVVVLVRGDALLKKTSGDGPVEKGAG